MCHKSFFLFDKISFAGFPKFSGWEIVGKWLGNGGEMVGKWSGNGLQVDKMRSTYTYILI